MAVVPVIAAEQCRPGDPLKLVYGTRDQVRPADYDPENAIGIADPFLIFREYPGSTISTSDGILNEVPGYIRKGDRFYMFLKPGLATGLRHHYFCEEMDEPYRAENEHEEWLRHFCERWQFDYDQLIAAGIKDSDNNKNWDRYVVARGIDVHSRHDLKPGEEDLFWEHLEGLTGQKYNTKHRSGMGWSCSC